MSRRLLVASGGASGGGGPVDPVDPDPDVLALVGSSVGRLFAELGAEPLVAQAWSSLAGVAHLSTLARVLRIMAEGDVDVVVVETARVRTIVLGASEWPGHRAAQGDPSAPPSQ